MNGNVYLTKGSLGWTPTSGEWSDEVFAYQDYVPGTSSNQEDFSTLPVRYAGTWYSLESYPSWANKTRTGHGDREL